MRFKIGDVTRYQDNDTFRKMIYKIDGKYYHYSIKHYKSNETIITFSRDQVLYTDIFREPTDDLLREILKGNLK